MATDKATGFFRKRPSKEHIAKRFANVQARIGAPVYADGVQPLNPGFFQLEALRMGKRSKPRSVRRSTLKGI